MQRQARRIRRENNIGFSIATISAFGIAYVLAWFVIGPFADDIFAYDVQYHQLPPTIEYTREDIGDVLQLWWAGELPERGLPRVIFAQTIVDVVSKPVALLVIWIALSHFLASLAVRNIDIECPHCEHGIQATSQWRCGFCGKKQNRFRFFGTRLTPAEKCPSCKKKPLAVVCPTCSNDAVFDLPQYNTAHEQGFGFSGTAKEFEPSGHS